MSEAAKAVIDATPQAVAPKEPVRRREIHWQDRAFRRIVLGVAGLVVALLVALVLNLIFLSQPALEQFGFGFFTDTDWNPVKEKFGALSFIFGTLVSSLVALCISVPVSVGSALFLSELAPRKLAGLFGFLIEMLAAIPSVVYGLWGVFVLTPWLRESVQPRLKFIFGDFLLFEGPPYGIGMMAAGIILAIMVTPTITAVSREVFRSISRNQREAALALGATRWEMLRISVLSPSRSGILGAVILGLGRALGETMAVTMVIGNRPQISASLLAPAQTMASVIANEYAEASQDLHLSALAAVGLALFLVSFVIQVIARLLIRPVKRGQT